MEITGDVFRSTFLRSTSGFEQVFQVRHWRLLFMSTENGLGLKVDIEDCNVLQLFYQHSSMLTLKFNSFFVDIKLNFCVNLKNVDLKLRQKCSLCRRLLVAQQHWCQFHQHFTCAFFVQKCFAQLFSNYSLALYFFGTKISAQKLLVKCWWHWHQVSISSTFY